MHSVVLNVGRSTLAAALLFSLIACQSPDQSTSSTTAQPTVQPTVAASTAPTASNSSGSNSTPVSSPAEPSTAPSPLASSAGTPVLAAAKLTTSGLGPIKVGMTVKAASEAAGVELVALNGGAPNLTQSCFYIKPKNGPEGLEFMTNQGRIVRIDLRSSLSQEVKGRPVEVDVTPQVRQVTTKSGAKIGDTEAQLNALYPGQLEVSSHKYIPNGHYFTFVPRDAQDQNDRLIFETNGDRVTYIRAGRLPEVQWVERCG